MAFQIRRLILIALALLTAAPPAFAGPADQCMSVFKPKTSIFANFKVPTRDRERLDKLEENAVETLRKMQLTTDEAKMHVSGWLKSVDAKMQFGGKTSVMEHTALVHIARSGFLKEIPDQFVARELESLVEKSWSSLSGSNKSFAEIVETPLPNMFFRNASARERKFHAAVFRSPLKAAVGEAPATGRKLPSLRQVTTSLMLLAIGFSHAGGVAHGQIIAGAITGYTISAMAEWITHRYLLHPSKTTLAFLKKFKGNRSTMAFRFHTANHHGMFTSRKYSTETNAEWNGGQLIEGGPRRIIERRDAVAVKFGDDPQHLHDNQYGMSMNRKEVTTAAIGTMSVAGLMSYMFGFGVEGYAAALATAPLTAMLTKYRHPDLHKPIATAKAEAGAMVRLLMSSFYWRDVSQLHYVHHEDPMNSNFSLFLPGPDYFFHSLRKPDLDALVRMDELGLAY